MGSLVQGPPCAHYGAFKFSTFFFFFCLIILWEKPTYRPSVCKSSHVPH